MTIKAQVTRLKRKCWEALYARISSQFYCKRTSNRWVSSCLFQPQDFTKATPLGAIRRLLLTLSSARVRQLPMRLKFKKLHDLYFLGNWLSQSLRRLFSRDQWDAELGILIWGWNVIARFIFFYCRNTIVTRLLFVVYWYPENIHIN